MEIKNHNNRMQSDFGELALASAADAQRYIAKKYREELIEIRHGVD